MGIAATKTLAKVANRCAKKDAPRDGVFVMLGESDIEAALSRIALTDLWGVAGRTAARLGVIGIRTPLQLRDADPAFVRERISVVMQRMIMELRGVPCLGLEEHIPDRKSIMASRSLGKPVTTLQELEEAVSSYAARAAEKMRRQSLTSAHINVFLHTNSFKPGDPQYSASRTIRLAVATADTAKLASAACAVVRSIWKGGYRYKKAGVILLDLTRASTVQGDLWTAPDTPRSKSLMRAMDQLNGHYGRDTLAYAATGRRKAWQLRRDHSSPRYTTSWDELLAV